jgi:aminoglycoside/choline kinase family phosphotransferase
MVKAENELLSVKNWLQTACALTHFELQALVNDASFRRYFRVHVAKQTYVVMLAPPDKENISAFLAIAKNFAQQDIHVPEILAYDLEYGFILLSDLGNDLYLNLLNSENADDLYARALAVIPQIQACKLTLQDNQSLGLFDEKCIRFELNLFVDWFLVKHLKLNITSKLSASLEKIFQLLITSALEQPVVCIHRDYHSRNLLLVDKQKVGVLDFQDALYGPITYDAVSLLRDAYIDWPETRVNKWILAFYRLLMPEHRPAQAEFLRWFDLMGVQRHLKVLGIFARLCYRDNKLNYFENTGRLVQYLRQISEKYPELDELKQLLYVNVPDLLRESAKK